MEAQTTPPPPEDHRFLCSVRVHDETGHEGYTMLTVSAADQHAAEVVAASAATARYGGWVEVIDALPD